MVGTVASYVGGAWVAPPDGGSQVVSPVSGEVVAAVSTAGIDMGAVVAHGRDVGGPALRALTFHQRAAMVRELVDVVAEHKDELYELSARSGATTGDAWVDVDGGMGVLATYASQARRHLPDGHVVVDGDPQPLSRDGTFLGLHVRTPRVGVAVHVNAFNFPCWGALEKLAPALIAGVPVISKPATPTAYVAGALFRRIVESGVLPEGAVQFVAGPVGDLFDHLDGRDLVGFTGSAATAGHLRGHPAFTQRSATFVAETDSLNASVLLPAAADDGRHVERFVAEVVHELTTKAGQRCTAIRRAMVPRAAVERIVQRLREATAQVVLGDPSRDEVTMGSLVDATARETVGATVDRLLASCRRVVGTDDPALVGDVDPDAFMAPTVLLLEDEDDPLVHQLEPFGPVATLVPYDTVEDAVRAVNRGAGSLVASVFGDAASPDGRELFAGIAPWHGRILFVDEVAAPAQTGHGSPLPHLVHGGPGRAGGGEELGGIRGVEHYLQRTALQGSPDVLTDLVGRYLPGATRDTSGPHPFQRRYEELAVGDALLTDEREITMADIEAFVALSGDAFYAHVDEDAAAANPFFEGRVAHGYLLVAAAAGLFVWPDPGPVLANHGLERLRFAAPVYPGDRISVRFTCKDKRPRRERDQGTVVWDVEVVNHRAEVVASYDVLTIVARGDAS